VGGLLGMRWLITGASRFALRIMMTDPYLENLTELVTATKRTGVQNILETNLRSEREEVLERPLGSPRKFIGFDGLMFVSSHLDRHALPHTIPVSTETIIGPAARRPLKVGIPLLISGMAYKTALTDRMKYAFALGSSEADTATNTGEGPFLPKERSLANRLIVQYPRMPVYRTLAMLEQADALEIQLGQGASAGVAQAPYPHLIRTELPPLRKPEDLPRIVRFLKDAGGGVPVGVKFSFTNNLEREIDLCLEAGVDYLAMEGAQAATVKAAPILEDDFGLPTIIGLSRAVQHLQLRGMQDQVSLIVSGGFTSPGECLKALALGANAIYLGTMILFAASHTQTLKAVPWEPPTQLAVDGGKVSKKFNWRLGGRNVANFLISSTEEIKEGVRALGKHALRQVSFSDLIALDERTADITGVPLAYKKPARRYSNKKVRALVPSGGK
jgi:glutamate synthase domain-containing protein 2